MKLTQPPPSSGHPANHDKPTLKTNSFHHQNRALSSISHPSLLRDVVLILTRACAKALESLPKILKRDVVFSFGVKASRSEFEVFVDLKL